LIGGAILVKTDFKEKEGQSFLLNKENKVVVLFSFVEIMFYFLIKIAYPLSSQLYFM